MKKRITKRQMQLKAVERLEKGIADLDKKDFFKIRGRNFDITDRQHEWYQKEISKFYWSVVKRINSLGGNK